MSESGEHRNWRAVIDIGSNSVRLVIYDVAGSALLPHYNEKVMAGLGVGLAETGKLSVKGVGTALKALGRYSAILAGLNVEHVRVVATAAVRAAADGAEFAAQVKTETGLCIDIISGVEEARLSAIGLACGVHCADGLVGDLGGSSLELCSVGDGIVGEGETHMLGPLSIDRKGQSPEALAQMVRGALKSSKRLKDADGRLYLIGGAWRALAKLHMDLTDYPLHQLHAYRLDTKAIQAIRRATHLEDTLSRERLARAGERRVKVLPFASIVLDELFTVGGFSDAMVSSYGLREGVIMDGVTGRTDRDPLLDGAALCARLGPNRRAFGEALFDWICPVIQPGPDLFGETDLDLRLVAAACLMADTGARFHPDRRAKLAYDQALHGPYSSVTHSERAFIALAVGHRYQRQFRPSSRYSDLLDKRQARLAARVGAAMRLGMAYSGRSEVLLKNAQISRTKGQVVLSVEPSQAALVSALVERRLLTLANLIGLEPSVKVG